MLANPAALDRTVAAVVTATSIKAWPVGRLPVVVHGAVRPFQVDRRYVGEERLTDPFFADTIGPASSAGRSTSCSGL